MECGRMMIYFSNYDNGVKAKSAGYAAVFIRGEICDVQIYYRGIPCEEGVVLRPMYVFRDGTVTMGGELPVSEGMASASFRTGWQDFIQSGRTLEELECIYLDGVTNGICGGRPDGQDLAEAIYTPADPKVQEETEVPEPEKEPEIKEHWSLAYCLENFPELRLPFDGIRRRCCRISLEELEHLPEEWGFLKDNHFLLHGYYEYHHLLFVKLACRFGERYAIGIPGEFNYRNQYMAENFGCYDFAPLEPGKRRCGCFGYWYYYLK